MFTLPEDVTHFAADNIRLSSFIFLMVGYEKKNMYSVTERMGVQGHPIDSASCTTYW